MIRPHQPRFIPIGQGQTTNDTFYYSVKDSHGLIGTASVTITVPRRGSSADSTAGFPEHHQEHAADRSGGKSPGQRHNTQLRKCPANLIGLHQQRAFGECAKFLAAMLFTIHWSRPIFRVLAGRKWRWTFTYVATDNFGLSSTTMVSVTVTGFNDPPVAVADFYTTGERFRSRFQRRAL